MEQPMRELWRAALLIRQGIIERRADAKAIRLPEGPWSDCASTWRQIQIASARGWHRASVQLRGQLLRQVDYVRNYLHQVSLELQELRSAGTLPREGEIYHELLALQAEFDDVQCDFDAGELCVTTPSVTFEGVYLGPFQIRLDWSRLDGSTAYRIVALEPNPAASNDSVTHPHVSDEQLCEGDGRQAIRAALDEGRLFDFFLLVGRIVATYASGRAYVEMSHWCGSPCNGCDASMPEEDRCICAACDETYCPDCMVACRHCDQDFCVGCSTRCAICEQAVCGGCQQRCPNCGNSVCPDCVTDGTCDHCREEEEEDEAVDSSPDESSPASDSSPSSPEPTNPPVTSGGCCV
jgi:hypothetical protein